MFSGYAIHSNIDCVLLIIREREQEQTKEKRDRRQQEQTRVRYLGQEDTLEEGMTTPASIHAWEILWTKEPGRLQSTGSQRVGHD